MNKNFASLGLSAIMSASTIALTTVLTLAATTGVAHAQVTSSSVVGVVVDSNGNGVSNATVGLLNENTGLARAVTTNSAGNFSIRGLPVNGTYGVTVTAPGFQGERVEGVSLSLGDDTQLSFQLDGETAFEDEIVVVGQRQVLSTLAVGPNASFGLGELQNSPAINRNITDILRSDPRIAVDESSGGTNAIQCAGQNSRFNSFTLDGVQLNDAFGLNQNGYPTERQPFPFDALEQVSVELAPLDVIYGNFTACNINSVTKSGTNSFSGSAFIDYTDDGLIGKTAKGQDFEFGEFDEIRYGVTLGGPIIKDKLFFFAAYEKLEGANTYPNTSVTLNSVPRSVIDDIADISRNVYQYDPGFIADNFPNADEKVLVKLDWNISDQHRASGTFQWNDGFNIARSDGDPNELEFSNHFYERGTELFTYTGALFSDWTDNFSTEFRASYTDVDNRQETIGGTDFGEFRIELDSGIDVYLGGDDSRSANDLNYDVFDIIARANYTVGDHTLTFGAETQTLNVFNLFIQQAQTEVRFSGLENFRNGRAFQIEFNNAPSLNPLDAAAEFSYTRNAVYLQDDWDISDELNLVAGLRYDWYTSDDVPVENPEFLASYGFSNAQNFDGVDILQPRIGLTYEATDTFEIHGGVGRYSGGNPNVWLSNNYSSNNVTQVGARLRDFGAGIDLFSLDYTLAEDGVPNAPGFAVPQTLADDVASGRGRNFEINYLDPDFKIPTEWKYSIGATWAPTFNTGESIFGGDWFFQGDLLWSQAENTAIIQRGDLVQSGSQIVDGVTYPTYDSPLLDSFVLTNADENNRGFIASVGASKTWDSGWSARVGYAYSDAKDTQPMTSAVAFSNYNNRVFTDPQEQVVAVSNYNTKHRFTANVSYEKDFVKNYNTRFDLFALSQSGRPYSVVQNRQERNIYGFTPFLSTNRLLEPGTERNEFTSPSWSKIDLRISQKLPGLRGEDRTQVFMVIDNLTNLINSDWGVLQQADFPNTRVRQSDGSLSPFSTNAASVYEIRFGAKYDF